jgi:hypothetical protein
MQDGQEGIVAAVPAAVAVSAGLGGGGEGECRQHGHGPGGINGFAHFKLLIELPGSGR